VAQLRLDSIFQEFIFSPQELIQARTLSPLQIQYLSTRYAELMKEKNSKLIPPTTNLDREYILEIAEIEGKLNFIQELFEGHKQALEHLKNIEDAAGVINAADISNAAERASQLVNQPPEGN